jgi:hypothetical protein
MWRCNLCGARRRQWLGAPDSRFRTPHNNPRTGIAGTRGALAVLASACSVFLHQRVRFPDDLTGRIDGAKRLTLPKTRRFPHGGSWWSLDDGLELPAPRLCCFDTITLSDDHLPSVYAMLGPGPLPHVDLPHNGNPTTTAPPVMWRSKSPI